MAVVIIVATLAVGWLTTMVPGYAQWWGPLPLTIIVPAFITESDGLAMVPIFFIASLLTVPVIKGRAHIPWATTVPVAALIVLAWLYFAGSISYGLRWQGSTYVLVCASVQVVVNVALVGLWMLNRRHHRYALVVVWHMLTSIWLASYAFPYYGELP